MEAPLATYSERRLFGSRTFRLFPAHVELQGTEGRVRYNLHQLLPTPKTGSTTDGTTKYRLWVAALAMVLVYMLVPWLQPEAVALLRQYLTPFYFLLAKGAYLISMLVLLGLAFFWRKQYDFAAFEYEPGNPAFHLLKRGAASSDYASFVELLQRQIAASSTEQPAAASSQCMRPANPS